MFVARNGASAVSPKNFAAIEQYLALLVVMDLLERLIESSVTTKVGPMNVHVKYTFQSVFPRAFTRTSILPLPE